MLFIYQKVCLIENISVNLEMSHITNVIKLICFQIIFKR
jgi:hypothetical protein